MGQHFMSLKSWLQRHRARHVALVAGQVVADATRCVQCGICTYNCPMGIDVRRHAWRGEAIRESSCLTCGECVMRCPRGVLRFERLSLFQDSKR